MATLVGYITRPWAEGRSWIPDRRQWIILAVYGLLFAIAHRTASYWGGTGFFSLWYPAAGIRIALLWLEGAKLTPAIALTELFVDLLTGDFDPSNPDWPIVLISIIRPVIAYGATVWIIRWYTSGSQKGHLLPPMPFGLAAVAGPHVAALAALPQVLFRPDLTSVYNSRELVTSIVNFAVGDLLGSLILAPPLLWLADLARNKVKGNWADFFRPPYPYRSVAESLVILTIGIIAAAVLQWLGPGMEPLPIILAIAWVGLRFGGTAAWFSVATITVLVLPYSAYLTSTEDRLNLHLGLAMLVVVGYLAGCFTDAQRRARADLDRRNRMLFQAERLKTLRAMSVAVIHEISQPLSTLSIEAKHLHEIVKEFGGEAEQSAALVERKAATLSTLVRRLRRYGGRAVDEPSPLPLRTLLETVQAILQPELKAAGARLRIGAIDEDHAVMAQEVELAQAAVNLVRNAIQASTDQTVAIEVNSAGEWAEIKVLNHAIHSMPAHGGMGIGALVAHAIVEAHGGKLEREITPQGQVCASIHLPLIGATS